MNIENSKEKKPEELDLLDLLSKMWNACYFAVGKLFVYLLRKSLWIGAFIAVGVCVCIYLSSAQKKYYSSTVQLRSNVNSALVISQIDVLNNLIAAGKYENLALILQLPVEVAEDVRAIKGLYAIDANADGYPDYADFNEYAKNNPRDTTVKKLNDYLYLNLEVYSDAIFPNVAQTLKDYIRRNEFLRKEHEVKRIQNEELLVEVKKQVSMLDSFQRVEYFDENRRTQGKELAITMGDKSRQLFHSDYIALYRQQQFIERDLELYGEIITIVQDFPSLSSPANTFMSYIERHLWKFILLGFVCIILWDNRKYLLSHIFGSKKTVS